MRKSWTPQSMDSRQGVAAASRGRRLRAGRVALLLALLAVAGCARFNVRSDWDRSASFESFERYELAEPPALDAGTDPFQDNSLVRKRLRRSLETALADRGYRRVEAGQGADFVVTWSVQVDDRLRVDDVGGVGVYPGFGYGWGGRGGATNIRNYQESTLVIDFLSVETREILWRGWGTGIVTTRDRTRSEARMLSGVQAILGKFPPPAAAGAAR